MKKRIIILLSSILCVLVTVSLVATTLVGVFKLKSNTTQPQTPPIVDTNVGADNLESENKVLNFIVGDEFSDGILTTETYAGTLFSVQDGKLIATTAGKETVSVRTSSVITSYQISVYEKGDGTKDNPYNIIRAEDLIKLTKTNQGVNAYYVLQCDLDLNEYESWEPIGKLTTPFIGSFDGNGYAIKNMNISITPENKESYIDSAQKVSATNGTMLTAGFFGFVGDVEGNSDSEIKNLNIHNATINTALIETEEELVSTKLSHSYIGVIAGYVANTTITGENSVVTSNITSSLYCDDTTTTRGAVSAFVGGSISSDLSGYTIKSNITAKNPGTVTEKDGGYVYNGTTIAGVLGRNNNTNVNDFVVELSVNARNYENMVIAGAVGYIVNPTTSKEIAISNIKVESLYVSLSKYSYTSSKTGIIAGAVSANYNKNCTLENIQVNNIIVNAIGTGQVAGIIDYNKGTVKNCTVSGLMQGTVVAGVVNTNFGTIIWNEESSDLYAVDVTLKGQTKVAGVAIYNFGKLTGANNLTQIKAVMLWSVVRKDFDKIKNDAMMAGVAVVSAGEESVVENFYTLTNMVDVINAGGVVGTFGAYNGYEGGVIRNIDVNTTIRTLGGEVGLTTYSGKTDVVGGVVAKVAKTNAELTISDVRGNITVNNTKTINTNNSYGLNIYGTIIGKAESNVDVISSNKSATVEATIFTNATSASTQYIGYAVGLKASGVSVSLNNNVKIVIHVVATADGAVINEQN